MANRVRVHGQIKEIAMVKCRQNVHRPMTRDGHIVHRNMTDGQTVHRQMMTNGRKTYVRTQARPPAVKPNPTYSYNYVRSSGRALTTQADEKRHGNVSLGRLEAT